MSLCALDMTKQLHLTFQPTHQHTSDITTPSLIPSMGGEGLGMRLYHTLFNCQSTVHLSYVRPLLQGLAQLFVTCNRVGRARQ